MLATDRKLFIPNAVFIPMKDGKEGRDFDRTDCTLAHGRWGVLLRRSLHRRSLA